VATLIFGRLIYAVNWYNFAAVFALVAHDFNQNVSGLGAAVGSFYLGVGLFQIPGGLLAAKIGPKRTAVFGTLLASGGAMLTSLSTNFTQLPVLRFIVGVGMAFVFGPGVILMTRYFREKAEGFSVGLFNAAYYVGGALGLFAWAVLANAWGWRESLALSGGIGVLTGILIIFLVPKDTIREDFAMELAEIRRILSSRWLFVLGVGMFGITGFSSLVTAFMVYYLEAMMKTTVAIAGIVGALAMLASLLSSPTFGMLYDRTRNASGLIFVCGILGIAGLEVASIPNILGAVLASLIVGLTAGGALTVGFSAARELAHAEYETLAVSFINSVQLYAGFIFPPLFSLTAVELNYSTAWMLSGLYMFPFTATVLLTRSKHFASGKK
jgi:MFS family permease